MEWKMDNKVLRLLYSLLVQDKAISQWEQDFSLEIEQLPYSNNKTHYDLKLS